jgi:pyridoxal biosynthesis lyase PdxS
MNGNHSDSKSLVGTWEVKVGLAKMLKGGVIMDVINPEQVKYNLPIII